MNFNFDSDQTAEALQKKNNVPTAPHVAVLLFLLTVISSITYFYFQSQAALATSKNEVAALRADTARLKDTIQLNAKQNNNDNQYTAYLQTELVLLNNLLDKHDAFTSYQYGFNFDQRSAQLPLTCREEVSSILVESPAGPGTLTVLCNWKQPQRGENYTQIAEKIVTDHNLITPITFTMSLSTESAGDTEKVIGKNKQGISIYKDKEMAAKNTRYLYTFYSPDKINTTRQVYDGDFIRYTLKLEVFDTTDGTSLDTLAKQIIDQVTFVNVFEMQ